MLLPVGIDLVLQSVDGDKETGCDRHRTLLSKTVSGYAATPLMI